MPTEVVTVTVTGANPVTQSININVDINAGTGSATFSWPGLNFGLDSISASATIQGQNLISNVAQHRWGFNDIPDTITNGSFSSSNTFYTFVVIGVFPDGTTTGSTQSVTTSNTHFFLNWSSVPGVSFYNVYCTQAVQGSSAALTATIGKLHGVGSGNGGNNSSTEGGGGPNYPPSVTQLWMDNGTFFPFRGDGTAPPATNTSLQAPIPGPATGNLTITPTGTASVVNGIQALTVSVSGITYAQVSYIPAFESVTGSLPLYNSSSSPVFNYPIFNGSAVDKASAATNAWVLSGNNASYQGRMSIAFDGTNFNLNYNGASPDNHVDTTNLTIIADDIAWFFAANKSYDIFNQSGGISLSILVNWYVKPTVSSVTPTSAAADGQAHAFTVNLAKPISPRQQGTQFSTGNSLSSSFSMVGGTVTNPSGTAIFDGQGWLTGWTVNATIPASSVNGTATLSATISAPTLTYLNGGGFTTGAVTYINGTIATINLTGSGQSAPQAYSFSISPAGPTYSSGNVTLTGIVFQPQNNPVTMNFVGVDQVTSSQYTIGAGTQTNRVTGTFNGQSGYLTTFTLTALASVAVSSNGATLGFVAIDSTNGLQVNYLSSTIYTFIVSGGGGGGGGFGGGCPAVEMFVDDWHQVADVFEGMGLDTLAGEATDYLSSPITTEARQVEWFDFGTQVCYHLIAENGAEVIVSGSTPVPTRESIESLAGGTEEREIKAYASDIQAGMHVITGIATDSDYEDDRIEWSKLVSVTCVGERRVCRLYCGGRNFAAGVTPTKWIYTHNIQLVVK